MKTIKQQIQDAQQTPRRNIKGYTIIKLLKINDKEKILRLERGKLAHYLFLEKIIMTADF